MAIGLFSDCRQLYFERSLLFFEASSAPYMLQILYRPLAVVEAAAEDVVVLSIEEEYRCAEHVLVSFWVPL